MLCNSNSSDTSSTNGSWPGTTPHEWPGRRTATKTKLTQRALEGDQVVVQTRRLDHGGGGTVARNDPPRIVWSQNGNKKTKNKNVNPNGPGRKPGRGPNAPFGPPGPVGSVAPWVCANAGMDHGFGPTTYTPPGGPNAPFGPPSAYKSLN